MLGPDEVAFGDLSRFSTIVLGIRAYEKRADVRAYNQRLLDFARGGGHLVVQYNKVAMNQLGAGAAGTVGGFGGGPWASGPAVPVGEVRCRPLRGRCGGCRRSGGAAAAVAPQRRRRAPTCRSRRAITSNRVSVEEAPIRVLEAGRGRAHGAQPDHGDRLPGLGAGTRALLLRR